MARLQMVLVVAEPLYLWYRVQITQLTRQLLDLGTVGETLLIYFKPISIPP